MRRFIHNAYHPHAPRQPAKEMGMATGAQSAYRSHSRRLASGLLTASGLETAVSESHRSFTVIYLEVRGTSLILLQYRSRPHFTQLAAMQTGCPFRPDAKHST